MNRLHVQLQLRRGTQEMQVDAQCERFPLVLLGPSGAGKTTLLECLAGLVRADTGRIVWQERTLFDSARGIDVAPELRRIGYVMQDGVLFPHKTVRENVLFPLRRRDSAGMQSALQLLDELGIAPLAQRFPHQISGGERARVALARALATRPQLLLLDEPFAGLDPVTETKARRALVESLRRHDVPALLVTHDRNQALSLGAWTWLLLDGRLAQTGSPSAIVRRPATAAIADFVGMENLIEGRVEWSADGLCRVRCADHELVVQGDAPVGAHVYLGVRPEELVLATQADPTSSERNQLAARVVQVEPEGLMRCVDLDAGFPLRALVTRESVETLEVRPGRQLVARFKATAAHLLERSHTVARGS